MIKARDIFVFVAGFAAAVGVSVLGLYVSRGAHGWPWPPENTPGFAAEVEHSTAVAKRTEHSRTSVELDPAQLESIGIRTTVVEPTLVATKVRAVASVVADESLLAHVHTRVSGWIEELYVNTTGQSVRSGQALAGIFSQELLASQNEYLAAKRGASPGWVVLQSAKTRLQVLGMSDKEIHALDLSNQVPHLQILRSPRSGVVIHRGISVGTAVDPSTEIITIADLSRVWVVAEVPEQWIAHIKPDMPARVDVPASGKEPFLSKVDFLYPTLTERTRTLRVRLVVDNRKRALRPGLYANVEFDIEPHQALTVPRDAVVDTGDLQCVYVAQGPGRFVPQVVKLGVRSGERIEIVHGLALGQTIVASGVFLLDSESRLRTSSGGTGHVHSSHAGHDVQPASAMPAVAPKAQDSSAQSPASPHDHHKMNHHGEHMGHKD